MVSECLINHGKSTKSTTPTPVWETCSTELNNIRARIWHSCQRYVQWKTKGCQSIHDTEPDTPIGCWKKVPDNECDPWTGLLLKEDEQFQASLKLTRWKKLCSVTLVTHMTNFCMIYLFLVYVVVVRLRVNIDSKIVTILLYKPCKHARFMSVLSMMRLNLVNS